MSVGGRSWNNGRSTRRVHHDLIPGIASLANGVQSRVSTSRQQELDLVVAGYNAGVGSSTRGAVASTKDPATSTEMGKSVSEVEVVEAVEANLTIFHSGHLPPWGCEIGFSPKQVWCRQCCSTAI